MTWLEDYFALALTLSPVALTSIVFVSAWLELVFPPYFGDSVMLFGFFLAGQGVASPAEVFIAAVSGSILGSVVAFLLGERFGPSILGHLSWKKKRLEAPTRLRRLFEKYGETVLVVNRFIPFFRNFMIYGAGAFRLRLLPSMVANTVSIVAFVSMLMAIGLWTAGSWAEIQATFQQTLARMGVLVMLAISALVVLALRRSQSEIAIKE